MMRSLTSERWSRAALGFCHDGTATCSTCARPAGVGPTRYLDKAGSCAPGLAKFACWCCRVDGAPMAIPLGALCAQYSNTNPASLAYSTSPARRPFPARGEAGRVSESGAWAATSAVDVMCASGPADSRPRYTCTCMAAGAGNEGAFVQSKTCAVG